LLIIVCNSGFGICNFGRARILRILVIRISLKIVKLKIENLLLGIGYWLLGFV